MATDSINPLGASIQTAELDDGAVTTAKIASGAVTVAKLDASAKTELTYTASNDNLIGGTIGSATTNTSYVKIGELTVNGGMFEDISAVRIYFQLRVEPGSSGTAYGRVYADDVALGTERSTTSTTFQDYSEDLDLTGVTKIQIYAKHSVGGANEATIGDFRIRGVISVNVDNLGEA